MLRAAADVVARLWRTSPTLTAAGLLMLPVLAAALAGLTAALAAAGTLAAVFWRKLNRSMANPSTPLVADIKPSSGSEKEPKVEAAGLIQSEAVLGEMPKSYLPTRRIVSPA